MLLIYSCSEDVEVPLSSTTDAPDKSTSLERDPFESNYKPLESERTLIKSVNLYDGLGNEYSNLYYFNICSHNIDFNFFKI